MNRKPVDVMLRQAVSSSHRQEVNTMHTLALVSQKGGAGKTTLAHTSPLPLTGGFQVAIADLDPLLGMEVVRAAQGSSRSRCDLSRTARAREGAGGGRWPRPAHH